MSPAASLRTRASSLGSALICSQLFSLLVYENDDQLLWDPNILPEREVEEFLFRAIKRRWDEVSNPSLPEGEMVKDNEQVSVHMVFLYDPLLCFPRPLCLASALDWI